MTLKNIAKLLFVTFSLAVLTSCSQNTTTTQNIPEVTGNFEFSILKVGQADAIILNTEHHCIVIDCGESDDGDEVVSHLSEKGIESIDYLFITHFDKDHVGGVPEVLDNICAENIVIPNYKGSNDEYASFLDAIEKHSYSPVVLSEATSLTLDDVLFEVYPPKKSSYHEGDNDFSVAISVTHGENRFLFTGDAEEDRLLEILSQTSGDYDFLKVPHHGKYNKLTKEFIQKMSPEYTVTCCSDKNPAEDNVVSILNSIAKENYYTKDGDVNVLCDGKTITVTQ